MLRRLRSKTKNFERVKQGYRQEIQRGELLKGLAELCAENKGCFTRLDVEKKFGVSRYKAQKMLDDLVNEEFPKYYYIYVGRAHVYRKTGT